MISDKHDNENVYTVDANVFNAYVQFTEYGKNYYNLSFISKFSEEIINNNPIAWNDFIAAEYRQLCGDKLIGNWVKKSIWRKSGIRIIECRSDCPNMKKSLKELNDNYGFDKGSDDVKYLVTSYNTNFKHLITENTEHFMRKHKGGKKRRDMVTYVRKSLGVNISRIDSYIESLGIE